MASTDEIFEAIEAGDADRVRAILVREPNSASVRDEEGVSALMRARYRLDAPIAQAILSADPDLDVFEAASFGDVDRLSELLAEDPSLAGARSGDGFTALHFAAFFGKPGAAHLLVSRGADVDAVGTGWMTGTALHSAAAGRHQDVVALLLEAGANPDLRQSHGWTALHSAAHNGDADTVELLLARGARRDVRNDGGVTPAELARQDGHAGIAERLDQAAP
jgi:ankyrin repeat protein